MPAILDDVRVEHGLPAAVASEQELAERLFGDVFPEKPAV